MARRYLTTPRLATLDARLSDRDRALLASLRAVRLATGEQLERLHFAGQEGRHRRRALTGLVELGLLARLPRVVGGVRAGSSGYLYALDIAGQRLTDRTGPARGRRLQRPWTPGVPFIAHTLLVTELYVQLIEAARADRLALHDFQTEPASWRSFSGPGGSRQTLKPDAYLHLGVDGYVDYWFIEVDRGTEAPDTIRRKAEQYRAYWSSGREQASTGGVFPRVLFLVPDTKRQAVITEVMGQQKPETWELYRVAVFPDALTVLLAGAAS